MPQALPLPDKLSADCSKRINYNVMAIQYGDGYAQRAPNGLNAQFDVWTITWIWLNATDAGTVRAALNAVGGHDYLTWTPPGEASAKRFIVEPESRFESYHGGNIKIGVTLRQVF